MPVLSHRARNRALPIALLLSSVAWACAGATPKEAAPTASPSPIRADTGPSTPNAMASVPPTARGKLLFDQKVCAVCHSTEPGVNKVGPSVFGLWGSERELEGGRRIKLEGKAGVEYLRESILDPQKEVVKGFAPAMPTYRGALSEIDVNDLIEYIRSLRPPTPDEAGKSQPTPAPAAK